MLKWNTETKQEARRHPVKTLTMKKIWIIVLRTPGMSKGMRKYSRNNCIKIVTGYNFKLYGTNQRVITTSTSTTTSSMP